MNLNLEIGAIKGLSCNRVDCAIVGTGQYPLGRVERPLPSRQQWVLAVKPHGFEFDAIDDNRHENHVPIH